MDISELKRYTDNLDAFTAREVQDLELMDDHELEEYQHEIETDSGNLSDWDHVRAFYTMKSKLLLGK